MKYFRPRQFLPGCSFPNAAIYIELMKIRISLLASVSAMTGFVLHAGAVNFQTIGIGAGVFLMAAGAGALNHYQDRFVDPLFSRTRNRPLSRGLVSSAQVLALSTFFIVLGVCGLIFSPFGIRAAACGVAAVLFYNGLYTPLKKRTNLAMIPGTLTGMMPPLIGWSAAGGDVFAPQIIFFMAVWSLWQVPHFGLLLLENRSEYQKSPFPSMISLFSGPQIKSILFVWITGFVCTALFLPMVRILIHPWSHWLLAVILFSVLVTFGYFLFMKPGDTNHSRLFVCLNSTMGLILALILADRLLLFRIIAQ